jgi:hypothetical protein
MAVLDTFGSSNTQGQGNIVPGLTVMEGEPLPAGVLATEAVNDLLSTWMTQHIRCAIEDRLVHDDPWTDKRKNKPWALSRDSGGVCQRR